MHYVSLLGDRIRVVVRVEDDGRYKALYRVLWKSETGVPEPDDTTSIPLDCEGIKQKFNNVTKEIKELEEMRQKATPSEKGDITTIINKLKIEQRTLESRAKHLGCPGI